MTYRIIDNDLFRCCDWIASNYGVIGSDMVRAIGLENNNGEMVAVTGYNNFTDKSCQIHFYRKKYSFTSRNYLWFVHYYPFVQAGREVLIAFLQKNNADIIKLAKHLDYVKKCDIDEAEASLYVLPKQNCKWIKDYG